ncbi:MAG: flagellar biosynthesis protein FlhA [Treponemataceae bacterium]|nr:flagellar biosynthesis protein FlhA [Treponemataceae bacterium]
MAENSKRRINLGKLDFKNSTSLAMGSAVIVIVLMLIIPLPTPLLDFFMACNLLFSVLIILMSVFITKAVDFSTFPTILLVSTVFGLGINVSSTRLILSKGASFDGKMVTAFGSFVVGGDETVAGLVIGLVIFFILILVQMMVITKGATRITEVQARFTLDAMPNKMMAIDAEFNSGSIDETEARKRKMDLQREVDFYSAMDGASKFISGSAKLGIAVTILNLVAGIAIGMGFRHESDVFTTYTRFTIGDGLLSQIPSLLVSVATGLVVTHTASDDKRPLGDQVKSEFTKNALMYYIAGGALAVFGILPGFPWYILIPMAAVVIFLGYRLSNSQKKEKAAKVQADEKNKVEKSSSPTNVSPIVPLDPLSLELGYSLISLIDPEKGGDLKERIKNIRSELGNELGLVVPPIRMTDNINLEASEYLFRIKGAKVGSATIRTGCYLCMNTGGVTEEIPGEATFDPAFGMPAIWVSPENCELAERNGYTIIDPPTVIATHITEMIKKNASEILGRQEVRAILDELKKTYPTVVEEVEKGFTVGEIQKVLQGLLREQVSIRNMVVILETMADYASVTKDTTILVEKVRQHLAKQISSQYVDENNTMHVLTIEPSFCQKIADAQKLETDHGLMPILEPVEQKNWISAVSSCVAQTQNSGFVPIILCPQEVRSLVKLSFEREMPGLVVLSIPEIDREVKLVSLGEIHVE